MHDISRDETRLKDGIELVQLGFFFFFHVLAVASHSQGFGHQQNIAATMSIRYHQRGGNAESSDGKNAQSLPKRKEIELKKSLLSQLRQLQLRLWSRFLP